MILPVKIPKTNAARLLDKAGVSYALVSYQVDEKDLSATHLAAQLGVNPACLFKTLVLHGDKNGHFVCLLPADAELDLKKAARHSGNKSCSLIAMKDLQATSGYVRGACSPFGMKKSFPCFVHLSLMQWDSVYVSAGVRGLQLVLAPAALLRVAQAVCADIVLS